MMTHRTEKVGLTGKCYTSRSKSSVPVHRRPPALKLVRQVDILRLRRSAPFSSRRVWETSPRATCPGRSAVAREAGGLLGLSLRCDVGGHVSKGQAVARGAHRAAPAAQVLEAKGTAHALPAGAPRQRRALLGGPTGRGAARAGCGSRGPLGGGACPLLRLRPGGALAARPLPRGRLAGLGPAPVRPHAPGGKGGTPLRGHRQSGEPVVVHGPSSACLLVHEHHALATRGRRRTRQSGCRQP
mmetsp:Transcript_56960/g.176724  ORF Transcript_56960/g.176724 Transcript_56960/m.176724 type:complete len:242 (+) Transcript_56960:42-767(+)